MRIEKGNFISSVFTHLTENNFFSRPSNNNAKALVSVSDTPTFVTLICTLTTARQAVNIQTVGEKKNKKMKM